MQQTEEIRGTIEKIIFQSNDSGFMVFVLQQGQQSITVKGFVPAVQPGQEVKLSGIWSFHPKFGKQFDAQKCIAEIPTTLTGLTKFLSSGLIKGIGPSYATKLVDAFGTKVLEIIEQRPDLLEKVPGIGPKRAEQIQQGYAQQREISQIMVYLQDKDISITYATKIYKRYGAQAIAILQQNPYRLCEDIWGIGFKMADRIAQNMGFAHDSTQRAKAGVQHIITQALGSGHLYIQIPDLKSKTLELLELEDEGLVKRALHELFEEDKIKVLTHNNGHFVTLSMYYHAEKGIATRVKRLAEAPPHRLYNPQQLHEELRIQKEGATITLNDDQQRGIITALTNKITIITGGPGTGKTTLIKELLKLLERENVQYKLAAPTGRAAKRIMEGTGRHALTLHRLLEFDPSTGHFSYNDHKPLDVDFVIIDEASMIDVFLAHSIFKALPAHAQILFIGDVDQLPSVGAGNVLNDLIASSVVPCVRLKEIFRQAADSLIVTNAHRVNNGEFPTNTGTTKKDFYFIPEENPEKLSEHLHAIFNQKIKRHGIDARNTMVLVPMNRGIAGTQNLNQVVQKILNPHQPRALTHFGISYKVGDQVMQIRNNYDKNVFNGDVGVIVDIDEEDRKMMVDFQSLIVEYQSEEFDEIVLAYAVSIHKSQGSEYSAVVIPIFMQHFTLLQRNLIYTAITRAKRLCIIIGQARALAMAIKNNKSLERITFLRQYLTTDLSCR